MPCETGTFFAASAVPDLPSFAGAGPARRRSCSPPTSWRGCSTRPFLPPAMNAGYWSESVRPGHPSTGRMRRIYCDFQLALHEASRVGRSVAMFERPFWKRHERESQMEEDFLRALDCGGLALHFQPQIDCRTGRCVGRRSSAPVAECHGGPVAPTRPSTLPSGSVSRPSLRDGSCTRLAAPRPSSPASVSSGDEHQPDCGRRRGSRIAARGAQRARSVAS